VAAQVAGRLPAIEVLGPLPAPGEPAGERVRILLRGPRRSREALGRELAAVRAARSARKESGQLVVRMDWPG
jgi:primosomal protein N'